MIVDCDTCHYWLQIPGDTVADDHLTQCPNCGQNSWTICETSRLVMCQDCRNLISKRAKFCPHCGWTSDLSIPVKVIRFDPQFQVYVKMIIYFTCASIVVSALAFLLFLVIYTVKFAK